MILNLPDTGKSIKSAYKIPSKEQAIKYLHACAGLPT